MSWTGEMEVIVFDGSRVTSQTNHTGSYAKMQQLCNHFFNVRMRRSFIIRNKNISFLLD